ncbi:hypothetical protein SteCoe_20775 [Stentor coeruleus]|uniref:Uncharacterized protein n=1 Tax=Stentor coeruleus TaxID=5963 RepID=A0A1R2BRQ0_9CILI|nr:hypothetical protein SteCoe_20775 [Stentor coeruleus]
MESTCGDILINSFIEEAKNNSINICTLRTTSKSATKKQIIQTINDSNISQNGVIYIECFEEWPTDILCFIFEYLADFDCHVGFVIDISTDPRCLTQVLDADILQKLTVEQFFFPDFTAISTQILWDLTRKCNFPVMSQDLFQCLEECRSEAAFMKVLTSSLLSFFTENPLRVDIFIKEKELREFIEQKDSWIENLELFQIMAQAAPMSLDLALDYLNRQVYLTTVDMECKFVTEFYGKFKSRDFDSYENIEEYLGNLYERDIISEEELNKLKEDYLNIPTVQSINARDQTNSKILKWKITFILPKLRIKVINNIKPLHIHIARISNSEDYILNLCQYLDNDISTKILQQLLPNPASQENSDMQILCSLLKNRGKHIELNSVFNEFVKAVNSKETRKSMQSRFLHTCNCFFILGLIKQSKKRKKADCFFVEKNFFGRSTFYN